MEKDWYIDQISNKSEALNIFYLGFKLRIFLYLSINLILQYFRKIVSIYWQWKGLDSRKKFKKFSQKKLCTVRYYTVHITINRTFAGTTWPSWSSPTSSPSPWCATPTAGSAWSSGEVGPLGRLPRHRRRALSPREKWEIVC